MLIITTDSTNNTSKKPFGLVGYKRPYEIVTEGNNDGGGDEEEEKGATSEELPDLSLPWPEPVIELKRESDRAEEEKLQEIAAAVAAMEEGKLQEIAAAAVAAMEEGKLPEIAVAAMEIVETKPPSAKRPKISPECVREGEMGGSYSKTNACVSAAFYNPEIREVKTSNRNEVI